jgi:hypothetical protein
VAKDIRIGMTIQTVAMGNHDAAQDERATFLEAMDIVAYADHESL